MPCHSLHRPSQLDAIRAGAGEDVLREVVVLIFQELVEFEAAEEIGAG